MPFARLIMNALIVFLGHKKIQKKNFKLVYHIAHELVKNFKITNCGGQYVRW